MTISFREARSEDAEIIADFNCRLAQETEDRQLDRATTGAGVQRALMLAPEVRYFVAEADGRVIGQLMTTREWSDWRNGWMIWLQSVYVMADYRRSGVFRSLFEFAATSLRKESEVVGMRLYVEHLNATARACYSSLGFVSPGYDVLEIDYSSQH